MKVYAFHLNARRRAAQGGTFGRTSSRARALWWCVAVAAFPFCAATADPVKSASLWQDLGFAKVQQPFLEPDKAFVFSAEVTDPGTVVAHWTIAKDYYLYRDKFAFRIVEGAGVSVGEPVFPSGGAVKQDQYFGVMVVYYDHADVSVPLARKDPSVRHVKLEAFYQGCAEEGFCYSPMSKTVELDLPPLEAAEPAATR
jgi:thiol:disulfide interchange protein